MKFINLNIENTPINGVPCELLLYFGKLLKSNEQMYIHINSSKVELNSFLYKTITQFLQYNKVKNINLSETKITGAQTEEFSIKLKLCFSPKVNEEDLNSNKLLNNYINSYEQYYGSLPYFTETNKYVDKFMYINDVILQFGIDVTLH